MRAKAVEKMGDLIPDFHNARKHSVRNVSMIERSMTSNGFGRSILLANDGTIIAGNATYEAASGAGIEDMIVVESDGTRVIAVRRTDVEPGSEQFYKLAISDNRAAELASWDLEALQQVFDAGVDSGEFWFPEELATLFGVNPNEASPVDSAGMPPRMVTCPSCGESFSPDGA
jgi:hypothetical protein